MSTRLTVKQLKDFIKDLPDDMEVHINGTDYESVEPFCGYFGDSEIYSEWMLKQPEFKSERKMFGSEEDRVLFIGNFEEEER